MNAMDNGISGSSETPQEKSPRSVRFLLLIATIVAVVAAMVWAGAALVFASQTDPKGGVSPTPVAPATPTASADPEPTPLPERESAVATAPADCFEIYPQGFLDRVADEELNHESLVDSPISRYPAIEELREAQPGFECHWGVATEGGVANGVNTVNRDAQDAAIAVIEANDHLCEPYREGTVCRHSEVLEGDDETGTVWTIAEEHFFRDGLWVSTWWAGTESSIETETSGIYSTMWP